MVLLSCKKNHLFFGIRVAIIINFFAAGDGNSWLSSGKPRKYYPTNPVNPV
jgi:hypothetical protein